MEIPSPDRIWEHMSSQNVSGTATAPSSFPPPRHGSS